MLGTERGDWSCSCSKKVVSSYMGTTGEHGGGLWFSFLLQVPTAPSNTQTGSSRMSLPTISTARLQCASASPLEMEPSHLRGSSLHCAVHVKLPENLSHITLCPLLKECFTHTTFVLQDILTRNFWVGISLACT